MTMRLVLQSGFCVDGIIQADRSDDNSSGLGEGLFSKISICEIFGSSIVALEKLGGLKANVFVKKAINKRSGLSEK